MSKTIKENVKNQIVSKQIRMRPRWHFVLGATLSAIGLFVSAAVSVLAIQLLRFRLTHPGIGASRKLNFILTALPWYLPVLIVVGLLGGYLLLRRYDFSYRKNFALIIAIFIVGLFIGSLALHQLGIDQFLTRRGYFRQIYGESQNYPPQFGRGQGRMQNGQGRN